MNDKDLAGTFSHSRSIDEHPCKHEQHFGPLGGGSPTIEFLERPSSVDPRGINLILLTMTLLANVTTTVTLEYALPLTWRCAEAISNTTM